ncbi:hypothetical protein AURDEDRAFT_164482 [Auricularia subglabra TFB-10046 SS5]|nr:hypothetical protein AURDEDRAFT_164482 [Auricularia subglabra TFB-10046 SS5]
MPSAAQMYRMVALILEQAVGAVRAQMTKFNRLNVVDCLPPEILAACFLHLPFFCRINASHVSRAWRAAALASPQAWADIAIGTHTSFPDSCPALSAVRDLRIDRVHLASKPGSYALLFDLFPRLECIALFALTEAFADILPQKSAPASLRDVVLGTWYAPYDLMPHYVAWDNGNLRYVSIQMEYMSSMDGFDIEPLLPGAKVLFIHHSLENGAKVTLTAERPNGGTHSVRLVGGDWPGIARLVLAAQASLGQLSTVAISHALLEPFAPVFCGLPALSCLTIHCEAEGVLGVDDDTPDSHAFDWDSLKHLTCFSQRIPCLCAVIVQAWCDQCQPRCSKSGEDARGLVAQLTSLEGRDRLPEIEIQGFSAHVARSIDANGLRVSFNTVAHVGPLILRHADAFPYRSADAEWD